MKIFLALILLIVSAGLTAAQDGSSQTPRDRETKVKIKGDKLIVSDKSKPVRRALELQYAKLAEAIETKNFEAFQALRTPDFSAKNLNGAPLTPEQMTARAKALLANIQAPIEVGFKIETINLTETEAVATIRQTFSRRQTVGGQLRKVETAVTQDETWVQTPDGWKLKYVENERDLMWFVDGKRVEPGKPYDPDAPAYDPEAKP